MACTLTVTQSGYVQGGYIPTLADCKTSSWGSTIIGVNSTSMSSSRNVMQRVFGICWDRPGQYKKQSFVIMNGEEEGEQVLWVAKVLLTDGLSGVDRALGCVCLRWSTEDEIDRTLNIPQSLRGKQL